MIQGRLVFLFQILIRLFGLLKVTATFFFPLSFDEAMEKMTESTKLGLFSVTGAMIVLGSVGCEIGKQISNYSINYYNGGSYPLPQTILVRLRRTK